MRKIELAILLSALHGELLNEGESVCPLGVSTDSRGDVEGKVFFALRGENFDGHDYILDVLRRGALAVVADAHVFHKHSEREAIIDFAKANARTLFIAEDSRRALGDAAGAALALWQIPVIAITGSSGKTTTRSILNTLLCANFAIRTGIKNYNNDIGAPLTVFSVEEGDEILLLEIGMNHSGELLRLAEIARPKIVIITNIGTAHIENLGSREAIAAAKKESLHYFDEYSVVVLNGNDPFFDFLSAGVPGEIISFSDIPEGFDLIQDRGIDGYVLGCGGREADFALGGAHNLANLSAAVAVAYKLGLAKSVIAERIAQIRPVESRSQVVAGRIRIINDCYNANPESMRAGLSLLASVRGSRRIAVLADMLELGGDSTRLHGELGTWLSAGQVCDELVAVGPAMAECARRAIDAGFAAARTHTFPSCDEVRPWLADFVREGDTVLLKGSHGMHLEVILPVIQSSR
jgi:UDP-N-acetylmuramoyl-tripeptide--D-alanyl-D-alanine ligase